MRKRTSALVLSALASLGLLSATTFLSAADKPSSIPAAPDAVINAECAPWDGPAFAIQIPLEQNTSPRIVDIRVFTAPNLRRATVYRFPDATGKIGGANLQISTGGYQPLSGQVKLDPVLKDQPVQGSFDLTLPSGERVQRSFKARWGNNRPVCG